MRSKPTIAILAALLGEEKGSRLKRRITLLGGAAGALLAGCATAPPPLTAASPASPAVAEGVRLPRQSSLREDDLSRKTAAILSTAQKEQAHWDAYGPVSGSAEDEPKSKTSTDTPHDQH